ncbi:MAG: PadR family transcriptional regulator [Candidatus Diapherotrites archaeon]|uniref:PadR family transcriptional regulator n=1 Tax=Candidatus Iainarchaeum sp. TaxID=3101447 RepID=A0A8T4CB46_9ARCH|nr:PadR family transcriptional regulator [Candidatus Diapherotrites archaeon]
MADISSISMLELQVLWYLSQKNMHGYALIQDLSKHRSTPLTPGTLYPLLARFEKNDWIRISEMGDRDKKVYMLTENGQKILDKLAHEFTEIFDGIYTKYHCSACTHFLVDKSRTHTLSTLHEGRDD